MRFDYSVMFKSSSKLVWSLAFSLLMWIDCSTGNTKEEENKAGLLTKDIIFIVLSQVNEYHAGIATGFKTHFENQLSNLNTDQRPKLLFSHQDFVDIHGDWTVFPLTEQVVNVHADKETSWLVICDESTRVNISLLTSKLQGYNHEKNHFFGRALRDQATTIIHHFAFLENPSQFAYPDMGAGFVMSFTLVKHLYHRLQTSRMKIDFSIDPKHELALFIWDEDKGTNLTHIPEFCSADESSEASCVTSQPVKFPDCGSAVEKSDLFVAVKTCKQFHQTRVPVVKATWGKETEFIEYYSEVTDHSIPTIDLGVPNTDRGHCGKTMAIMKRVSNTPSLSSRKWLLIADDDTIINLERLRELLACYNPQQPVILGERYGYGVANAGGYNYITGGGGMVFSQPVVKLLAETCKCYKDDAPDDMTLGMCVKSLGLAVTHSRYFHQARPEDYSEDFLANQLPVSFHKHWNNDPYKVYAQLTAPSSQGRSRTGQTNTHADPAQDSKEEL